MNAPMLVEANHSPCVIFMAVRYCRCLGDSLEKVSKYLLLWPDKSMVETYRSLSASISLSQAFLVHVTRVIL